eukprot:1927657-Rhodomonas_salina.1
MAGSEWEHRVPQSDCNSPKGLSGKFRALETPQFHKAQTVSKTQAAPLQTRSEDKNEVRQNQTGGGCGERLKVCVEGWYPDLAQILSRFRRRTIQPHAKSKTKARIRYKTTR